VEINATTYQTIATSSAGIFKDKGSKFLSFAYPVKSEQEIKPIIDTIKKKYFDARHHCYAYRIGPEMKTFRANDDGEPSGTAGKPILGQIQSKNLTNILIVVVRYFGGTLLGTSGLIQAYKLSSADAIANAKIVECSVFSVYQVFFNYPELNSIMKIIKDYDLIMENPNYDLKCTLTLKVKKDYLQKVIPKLNVIENLTLNYITDN
jgi:uncharacterized YigZ family protein